MSDAAPSLVGLAAREARRPRDASDLADGTSAVQEVRRLRGLLHGLGLEARGLPPTKHNESTDPCDVVTAHPCRRLLFLDVDGVLHPLNEKHLPAEASVEDILARGEEEDVPGRPQRVLRGEFTDRNMAALKVVVDATGCSLVLSSTWRETEEGTMAVNQQLAAHGLPEVIGRTPRCESWVCRRAREIWTWLERHPAPKGTATRFVVLDDADLVERHHSDADAASPGVRLAPYFVRVDKAAGLTAENSAAAIRVLMG